MTISLENLRAEYTPWMALRVAAYPELIRQALTRIRQLRGRSLLRRFTLSATKRTATFMTYLRIARKNWKKRCSNASIMVKKTGDLLRLRQRRQSHLLRPPDISGIRPNRKASLLRSEITAYDFKQTLGCRFKEHPNVPQ